MKRIFACLIIVCLIALSVPAYAAQYAVVKTPTSDGSVYVRSVAGAGKPILGAAKNGDVLEIVKKGNTWHKVKVVRTGLTGYMYGQYIDFSYSGSVSGGWNDTAGNSGSTTNGSWGTSGTNGWGSSYIADASVKDADKVYNVNAVISSSDGYANLRWGPGMEYNIIGRVYNGNTVWAMEKNGDWFRCLTSDGRIGYISKGLLKLGDTASGAYGKNGVIRSSDGFAAVRTGAGTSHTLLYTMSVGEKTSVYAAKGQWYRVSRADGWGEAYIYRTLLRFNWDAVATGNVNMRKGPGTTFEKMGVLPAGTNVKLLATDGSFARVDTGDSITYVSVRYLNY